MEELITYQTFATEDAATIIADKLEQEGIKTEIAKKVQRMAATFIGDDFSNNYELKIAPSSFNKANALLYNDESVSIDDISSDHPLLMMSTDELKEITNKPYEWGAENYSIALALLKNKGIDIPTGKLSQLQEEHINVLSEKKTVSSSLLILGYASALIPFLLNYVSYNTKYEGQLLTDFRWYMPGLVGPLVAWSIFATKTTLPDGRRITPYTTATIKHALLIFFLNIFSWLLNVAIMLLLMK